jgi:hypothetical protein
LAAETLLASYADLIEGSNDRLERKIRHAIFVLDE